MNPPRRDGRSGEGPSRHQSLPGSFPVTSHQAEESAASPAPPDPNLPSTLLVDLRALDYLSPIDDNLVCSVCHCAFIKPVMMNECEHIFCSDCLEAASQHQKNTCPFCRSRTHGEPRKSPRALSNMVDDLKVRCPLSGAGCDVIVNRGCVRSHVDKYCAYVEVDCPAEHCASKVQRKDKSKACLHNLVACEDCHELVVQKDLPVSIEMDVVQLSD